MRISDWSSDVCSSDLRAYDQPAQGPARLRHRAGLRVRPRRVAGREPPVPARRAARDRAQPADAGADGDVVLARFRTPTGAGPGLRPPGGGRAGQPRQPVPHHPRPVPGPDRHLRAHAGPAAPLRARTALTKDTFAKAPEVTLGSWISPERVTHLGEPGVRPADTRGGNEGVGKMEDGRAP